MDQCDPKFFFLAFSAANSFLLFFGLFSFGLTSLKSVFNFMNGFEDHDDASFCKP